MHRSLPAFLVMLCALPTLPAAAAGGITDSNDGQCRTWLEVALPKADMGKAAEDCDAEALYYGSDGKGSGRDLAAVRHCAYLERTKSGDPMNQGAVFGGSGMLMMLYANAQGVKRNLPLAKRFACEYGGAPAELEGRLEHLDAIAKGDGKGRIDICDDITSGMMEGLCADRDAGFAQAERDKRWSALQAGWTPAQRAALARLRKAADDFFGKVSAEETDMSGTARNAIAIDASETMEIDFLHAMRRFEAGERPKHGATDLARADKALNADYKQALAALDAGVASDGGDGRYGTINAEGVRNAQRAWLRYRDAWLAFAALRYPATPAHAWATWLTLERSHDLKALVAE